MEPSTVEKRPLSNDFDENIFGPTLSRVDKCGDPHDIHVDKTEFKIGRSRDNDEIILDILISRRHCVLTCEGDDEWSITDLSSSVTFVNDVPLTTGASKTLHDGDVVRFSTSEKYVYRFNLVGNRKSKKPRLENEQMLDVFMRQKTFAENQECQKKVFTDELQVKQKEQDELKQRLETLLKEQDVTKDSAEEYKKEITTLECKIEEKNVQIQSLYTQFEELLKKLDDERRQFEKELKDEKEKWQRALNVTKLEKEMLELKMTSLMENKDKEEKDKSKLLEEKIFLEKKLQETEKALKEKEAKEEAALNNVAGPSNPNDSCIVLEIVNPLYEIIDLTNVSQLTTVEEPQENIVNKVSNVMEDQLTCSICSELFVKAMTLTCMHTFCQYCIKRWMKKKRICPICRVPIKSMTKSIVVDNFIDSMLENLPIQCKKLRKEIIEARKKV